MKTDRIKNIIRILKKHYKPECALNYKTDFELLAAVILSAQCTDTRVNIVTPELFRKFPDIRAFADADITELETAVKSTGFYKNKAAAIKSAALDIINKYGGKMPDTLAELVKLRGVGRKTANVVLAEIYGRAEGIVVDTHVKRLSFRIGFTESREPEKVEIDLMKIVSKKDRIDFAHLLILHGRAVCKAQRPLCSVCQISNYCEKNEY